LILKNSRKRREKIAYKNVKNKAQKEILIMNLPSSRITKFIKKHHVLTLATCVAEESWCCNCFYVFIEDEVSLLFTSENNTKHIDMGTLNPVVSGSIVLETKIIGNIQGIQFTGRLNKVTDEDYKKYKLHYLKRFPFAVVVKTELWLIKLESIKMTDNRLGFGKKLRWQADYES